jgi:hypothetical protein
MVSPITVADDGRGNSGADRDRSSDQGSPVNNRDNGANPRVATLHCVTV